MISLKSTTLFLKLFIFKYPVNGLCAYFSLFSRIASNPEETKSILSSLIKILRVDGVYSFLKKGSVYECLENYLLQK